jgi:serine/threonine protein kinase
VAHRQHVNQGLSADDIGRGFSATLSPELANRRGDEEGGLDGHASDAWALGAVLSMLLARDATLSHIALTTDLDRWPASSTAPAVAITSVGERQRRLYQLIFPSNAVPSNVRRESRFAPLIELAERLLRRDPAQRPPPDTVMAVLETSWAFLAAMQGARGPARRVTARHLRPSDDVREAWAGRSTPWWLRWCVRSQLYWAHVFWNGEAAWRREAWIARGVVLAWAAGTWAYLLRPLYFYRYQDIDPGVLRASATLDPCITFLLALGTPGYCVWFHLVFPHGVEDPFSGVTLVLWLFQLSTPSLIFGATEKQAVGFFVCGALGLALCPLWQALVTWLPAECRMFAVLGPISASAETVPSVTAPATHSRPSWSWGPFARARSKIDYPSEAALRSELAALQELARAGGAPLACTLTARDACDGIGSYRLALAIDVEPLSALIARPGAYTSWEAWLWLHQAVGALAYLHGRGMHHGNLNLESVLITSAPRGCGACGGRQVRLCRFSQAPDTSTAFASPQKADSVAAGQGGDPYDEAAADVWSLGVLVVVLLSRQPPPPPDRLRLLGVTAAREEDVLAYRVLGVISLCGLWREDDFYFSPEWKARSRFVHFITLAEWALRLLPSQRPAAAQAERYLSTSSVFVWRTHGAGVFRLAGLRRRWRNDLVDLLSPSETGLVLRQAVKVQVFWALTLSTEPQHAHVRRPFDRASAWVVAYLAAALVFFVSCLIADFWDYTPRGYPYISVAILLAPPDADGVWMCAAPRLVGAALRRRTSRTGLDVIRTEFRYVFVLLIVLLEMLLVDHTPLPAWFWPALGAVAAGRLLVVVGCAQLWVYSARYMGRPQQRSARAVDEGQPAGVEREAGRLSLLEHAV